MANHVLSATSAQRANFQVVNPPFAGAYGYSQIYLHVDTRGEICHIGFKSLFMCECASGINMRFSLFFSPPLLCVIYLFGSGSFPLPARQEMKPCDGCCGKRTLPVYP